GTVSAYLIAVIFELMYLVNIMKIKFPIKEFFIKPLITVLTMFFVVKLSYYGISLVIGGKIATVLSILVGATVYGIVIILIGGIKKEEVLTMPKGEKIYKILRKLNLMK